MAAPVHPLSSTTRSVVRDHCERGKFLASGQAQERGMDLDQLLFFLLEFYLKKNKNRALGKSRSLGKSDPKRWMRCGMESV